VILLVGLVLAALGPFGSFAKGNLSDRLGYWLAAVILGFLIFRPIVWLGDLASRSLDLPRVAAMGFAVIVAAIPGTVAIAWLNGGLEDGLPSMMTLAPLYLNVVLVGTLITLLFVGMERHERPAVTSQINSAEESAPATPLFLERLPADWRGELIALEMEDHYIRVHGPDGRSLLILMRMADAEREMVGIKGLRVHRSWWVVQCAVERQIREGRRLLLELKGGIRVPVARDRIADLRKAGWL
jgi:hypothetical protein